MGSLGSFTVARDDIKYPKAFSLLFRPGKENPMNKIDRKALAGMIDHTNLKAFATEEDFRKLCREAADYGFAMVAINESPVAFCKSLLSGTGVHVGAAISFPFGQTDIGCKVSETEAAIKAGADEIDYVLNVGKLKEGNDDYIRREMEEIVAVCRSHGVICKVIFENCYLTKDEIRRAALTCARTLSKPVPVSAPAVRRSRMSGS